jgi:hypothetical protein
VKRQGGCGDWRVERVRMSIRIGGGKKMPCLRVAVCRTDRMHVYDRQDVQ